MKFPAAVVIFAALCAGCGGGGTNAPTPVPSSTVTPVPATPSPSPTPVPTATPSAPPLAASYTTSWQQAGATPIPASSPIALFAQNQTATITPSGGTTPYSGFIEFCTSGSGFSAPFTFLQAPSGNAFVLTATQFAGSCTVVIVDSSNPARTIQMQALLTTTSGSVQ